MVVRSSGVTIEEIRFVFWRVRADDYLHISALEPNVWSDFRFNIYSEHRNLSFSFKTKEKLLITGEG